MYDFMYRFSKPGWDRDLVPPEVRNLAMEASLPGSVLDLGCGTGTHAVYLASQGHRVTGIDFSPKAISLARQKAGKAGVKVDFRIGDVTRLKDLHERFDIVLDVGCFHGLSLDERIKVAKQLASLTHAGSLFMLWAFDNQSHYGMAAGRDQVRQTLSPYFVLEKSELSQYNGRSSAWHWLRRAGNESV